MVKNNPLRCATPMCAFYAVVEGGLCADCERDALADTNVDALEAEWLDWQFAQAEIEAREAQWAEEQDQLFR